MCPDSLTQAFQPSRMVTSATELPSQANMIKAKASGRSHQQGNQHRIVLGSSAAASVADKQNLRAACAGRIAANDRGGAGAWCARRVTCWQRAAHFRQCYTWSSEIGRAHV